MTRKNMMKTGLAVAAAVVVMAGCGNNSASETTAAATAAEETTAYETKSAEELVDEAKIVLGEYKGLTRTIEKTEVTDERLAEEL